jgi:hypothetical protein
MRVTHGAGVSLPQTRSRGYLTAFTSSDDLAGTGNTTQQVFLFRLFDSDCLVAPNTGELTKGNAESRHPYVTYRLRSALKKTVGRGAAIAFESLATNLPGTDGGPGTQVYLGTTRAGDLPPIHHITPAPIGGCTPPAPGDSTDPTFDAFGRRLAFVSTGDFLCNATSGRRAFVLDPKRLPATLLQLTGRDDVRGPVAASMGHWFASLSTTDDVSGQGVCGHQLHVIDFFDGHWHPASLLGEVPVEPPAGNPDASCDDGDPCTTDACVASACQHAAIPACP